MSTPVHEDCFPIHKENPSGKCRSTRTSTPIGQALRSETTRMKISGIPFQLSKLGKLDKPKPSDCPQTQFLIPGHSRSMGACFNHAPQQTGLPLQTPKIKNSTRGCNNRKAQLRSPWKNMRRRGDHSQTNRSPLRPIGVREEAPGRT